MSVRRSHYELAFEAFLNRRGTPFVAVEDVKHYAKRMTGTKAFDYIVYPGGTTACLVDVKGRKVPATRGGGDGRQKNWVTRGDIEGLQIWQKVFGPEYQASFVFAYWHAGGNRTGGAGPSPEPPQDATLAGRRYSFWLVSVTEYAQHQKQLSKKWDTVAIPRSVFRRISRRLETVWPAAPC